MFWTAIGILALVVIALVVKLLGSSDEQPSAKPAFAEVNLKSKQVINATEGRIYESLLRSVPSGYWVFPAVRLADLMSVSATSNSARQSALNRLLSKHVDFAIIRSSDRVCAMVVEVDGPDHDKKAQKERDAIKDAALKEAGIALLRLPAGDYSPADLAQRLGFSSPSPAPVTRSR